MEIKTKCPQCLRMPQMWREQAANNSRELYWLGCRADGHLVGGVTQGAALQSWERFVAMWKFEKKGGMMKALIFAALVLVGGQNLMAASNQTYAEVLIAGAVLDGYSKVTLKFARTDVAAIEKVADTLRNEGYKVDEQAMLLNPTQIKLFKLPKRATLVREGSKDLNVIQTAQLLNSDDQGAL